MKPTETHVLFVFLSLWVPTITQVCQQRIDVVFLVENSNFIWAADWDEQRQFVSNIVNQFDHQARFGVVTFNAVGHVEVLLQESDDREYLHRQINNMQLTRGHCNVAEGLQTVREQVLTSGAGDRRDAVNVICIILNGWPTQDIENIATEVEQLQQRAVIVAVGVGQYAYDRNIDMLQPRLRLKAGFGNFSEDTAKDAARMICSAVPFVSDMDFTDDENELNEIEDRDIPENLAASLCRDPPDDVYRFSVTSIQDSTTFSFGERYRNTVILIVNVASFSDYTTQNYVALNDLIARVETDDDTHLFEIVGIPSDNFGKQEPADNSEILDCLRCVRPGNGYTPRFTITHKYDVNGQNEHPLYTYLKSHCDGPTEMIADKNDIFYSPLRRNDIAWNFEKILIDKRGKPYKRYNPMYPPANIYDDIMHLLRTVIP